jgi:hypothetical protein
MLRRRMHFFSRDWKLIGLALAEKTVEHVAQLGIGRCRLSLCQAEPHVGLSR